MRVISRFLTINIFAFMLLGTLPLWAAATIEATLDRDEMTTGEEAVLTISVSTDGRQKIQQPNIMENSHLTISFMGTSSSSSWINGQHSSSIEYRYLVAADAPGTYELEGISSVVDHQVLRAAPVRFKVVKKGEQNNKLAQQKGLLLEASLNKKEVYIGEQVVYKVRFIRQNQVSGASYEPPALGDFLTEQLGEQKNYETVINGRQAAVTEIKMALFPTKAGHLTIEPAQIEANVVVRSQNRGGQGGVFDDFFIGFNTQTKPVTISSNALELDVKPLPIEGRPAEFAGLVGDFEMQYNLSKDLIKARESTTLTVIVQGMGNIGVLALPPPASADQNFKIYEDKPAFDKKVQIDGIYGRYMAKWALVPAEAGEYKIPLIKIAYFDPQSGTYKTIQTPEVSFRALAGAVEEDLHLTANNAPLNTAAPQKQEVTVLGEDVMPLERDGARLDCRPLTSREKLWLLLLLLPPLLWLAFILQLKRQNRSPEQMARIRAGKAFAELQNNLQAAAAANSYEQLAVALRTYYAAKLKSAGCSITPGEVVAVLQQNGLPSELCMRAAGQLSQIEKAIYMEQGSGQLAALIQDVLATMKEVEHALPRK